MEIMWTEKDVEILDIPKMEKCDLKNQINKLLKKR
jgi:hypothetical protein